MRVLGALVLVVGCILVGVYVGSQHQLRRFQGEAGAALADGQCIVDVALGEDGTRLELQRLSGERSSVELPQRSSHSDGAQGTGAERNGARGDGAQGDSVAAPPPETAAKWDEAVDDRSSATAADDVAAENDSNDLACRKTKHLAWQDMKRLMGAWFGTWSAAVVAKDQGELRELLQVSMTRLQALHTKVEECGMGRLCMTLLAIAAGEAEEYSLKLVPSLHSPLLTILLDYPWSVVMRSGWPLFALLAQLHLRHPRGDDRPTSGHTADYFRALEEGLQRQEPEVLAKLGAEFVEREEKAERQAAAMPALCALGSQLLGADVLSSDEARTEQALQHMQSFFREAVRTIDDLQSTVESAWPLWGVLNAAAVQLAAASQRKTA